MTEIEPRRQLHDLLDRLDEVAWEDGPTPAFLAWRSEVEATLCHIFGDASPEAGRFRQIRYTPQTHSACLLDDEKRVAFQRGVAQARLILEALCRQLD